MDLTSAIPLNPIVVFDTVKVFVSNRSPDPELKISFCNPLISSVQSKESEAAQTLIQEVFCSY